MPELCGLMYRNAGDHFTRVADDEEISSPGNRFARQGVPEAALSAYRIWRRAAFNAENLNTAAAVPIDLSGESDNTIPE